MIDVLEKEDFPEREEYIWERNGVDLIPASIGLSAVEAKLRLEMGTEKILSAILEPLREDYDYILIDTCPSLGALTINAMAAADEVIGGCESSASGDDWVAGFSEIREKDQEPNQ